MQNAIAAINPHKDKMQIFGGIVDFFEKFMNKSERKQFFSQTLPKIRNLVFDVVKLFPLSEPVPLLVQNGRSVLITLIIRGKDTLSFPSPNCKPIS